MIRKNIDLPEETVKKLRLLAAIANTDVKNYIQEVVINHVKKSK